MINTRKQRYKYLAILRVYKKWLEGRCSCHDQIDLSSVTFEEVYVQTWPLHADSNGEHGSLHCSAEISCLLYWLSYRRPKRHFQLEWHLQRRDSEGRQRHEKLGLPALLALSCVTNLEAADHGTNTVTCLKLQRSRWMRLSAALINKGVEGRVEGRRQVTINAALPPLAAEWG